MFLLHSIFYLSQFAFPNIDIRNCADDIKVKRTIFEFKFACQIVSTIKLDIFNTIWKRKSCNNYVPMGRMAVTLINLETTETNYLCS